MYLVQNFEDITWHGEAARAFGVNWAVVPFKCHAGKAGAIDFLRDFVVLLERLDLSMDLGDVRKLMRTYSGQSSGVLR
jgi:hypothetical protein